MNISIQDSAQILQKVKGIDEVMRQQIVEVKSRLESEIQQLRVQADAKVEAIKSEAERNKKYEVDTATQMVEQESGDMVQEIQNLAYNN